VKAICMRVFNRATKRSVADNDQGRRIRVEGYAYSQCGLLECETIQAGSVNCSVSDK
jgi:hypothetical protein